MEMETGLRTGASVGQRTWLVTKCGLGAWALGAGNLGTTVGAALLKVLSLPGISLCWYHWCLPAHDAHPGDVSL